MRNQNFGNAFFKTAGSVLFRVSVSGVTVNVVPLLAVPVTISSPRKKVLTAKTGYYLPCFENDTDYLFIFHFLQINLLIISQKFQGSGKVQKHAKLNWKRNAPLLFYICYFIFFIFLKNNELNHTDGNGRKTPPSPVFCYYILPLELETHLFNDLF